MNCFFAQPQQNNAQHGPLGARRLRDALCAAAAVSALLFLLPAAQESLKALLNRLFAASEAVNAYVYDRFSVAENASPTLALSLLGSLLVSLLALSLLRKKRLLPLFLAFLLAFAEIWLGLTPPPALNALLFALLVLPMLSTSDMRGIGTVLAAFAAVFLAVGIVSPGVDTALEARSEAARDRLSALEQRITGGYAEENGPAQSAREENRLHAEDGAEDADGTHRDRAYRRLQEEEQQLSRPQRTRFFKLALLIFLIFALLTLPFAPFLFFNARRQRSLSRRAAFSSPDRAEAVRAMFLHLTAYLDACGMGAGNLPFSRWQAHLSEYFPTDYVCGYGRAAALFSEAAYSAHPMTEAQRADMEKILDETERILYDEAGWKQKLRLKYVECLHP